MSHSIPSVDEIRTGLLGRSRRLARRALWLVRTQAVLLYTAAVVALTLIAVMVDALLRREEVGLRWLSLVVFLAMVIYLGYRLLVPSWRLRISSLDVAERIERSRVELAGKLKTAIELAEVPGEDTRYGSSNFRNAVLMEFATVADRVPWDNMLTWARFRKALFASLATMALGAMFAAGWPGQSLLGLRRLLMPWSNEQWPRRDQLEILALPKAIGHATSLQVSIVDHRPPLPHDVTVELRLSGAKHLSVVSIPAIVMNDSSMTIVELPPLHEDVQVRAVGGDDHTMPWQSIKVIALPQWKENHFEIRPPDYIQASTLGLTDRDSNPANDTSRRSGGHIKVLAGSRVRFVGELDQSVQAIDINPHQSVNPWVARLGRSGTQVVLNGTDLSEQTNLGATIDQSTSWSFRCRMDDETELELPGTWKVEVIPDQPPEVSLHPPDLPTLSLGASIAISGTARDDWGLRDLTAKLTFQSLPEVTLELPIPLYSNAQQFDIQTQWDFVAELARHNHAIEPGEELTFWLEAHDHLGQLGKSQLERLTVQLAQLQLETIAGQQGPLNQLVRELLETQRTAIQLTQETAEQLLGGSPTDHHVDAMASVAQAQHDISQQLTQSARSVHTQMEEMLRQLEQNQLGQSDLAQNLRELIDQVQNSMSHRLETTWQKSVVGLSKLQAWKNDPNSSQNWADAAEQLIHAQSESLGALTDLVQRLDANQASTQLRQELQRLAAEQHTLSQETEQLQLDSLRQPSHEFERQQMELSEQQRALAGQLDRWFLQAQEQLSQNTTSPSRSLQPLQNAFDLLSKLQTATHMRSAGSQIQSSQLGQAVQVQQQVNEQLQGAVSQMGAGDDPTHPSVDEQTGGQSTRDLGVLLTQLVAAQTELIPSYAALDRISREPDRADDFQTRVSALSDRQGTIRDDLRELRLKTDERSMFYWVFEQSEKDLAKAMAAARRGRLVPDASQAASDALAKLSAVMHAWTQVQSDDEETNSNDEELEGEDVEPESNEGSSPDLAELEASLILLRSLQLEINRQTGILEDIADPIYRNSRLLELTRQQDELSERLGRIMEELEESSTENIDILSE